MSTGDQNRCEHTNGDSTVTEQAVEEELASEREVKPARASVRDVTVRSVQRISSGYIRITVASDDPGFDDDFSYLGYDQWLRLFLPNADATSVPPYGDIEGWYSRWTAGDPDRRTVIRNYTIRDARRGADGWELDIDFVVHAGASDAVEGIAANWAVAAQVGNNYLITFFQKIAVQRCSFPRLTVHNKTMHQYYRSAVPLYFIINFCTVERGKY